VPTDSSITITLEGRVTVLTMPAELAELDELQVASIRDELLNLADTADRAWVVLDLSNVEFFGPAFIEVIFRVWHRVTGRNEGKFAIVGLGRFCREVIHVTHLDNLWNVHDARNDAVRLMHAA